MSVCEKVEQSVLMWFGHLERMEEDRLVKRVYQSDAMGVRMRGRPRRGWMDGVIDILGRKGLSIEEARECVQDRCGWCNICRGVDTLLVRFLHEFMKWPCGRLWILFFISFSGVGFNNSK